MVTVKGVLALLFFFAVCCLPSLSIASLVTYEAVGTVTSVADDSGLGYIPATILNAPTKTLTYAEFITFDNAAAAVSSTPTSGIYRGTSLDMSVSVLIDGIYAYAISTPSSSDEIDLSGTDFELFKRGPTTYTSFAPNPPFSHVDFEAKTQSDQLSTAVISAGNPFTANGISDQQTSGAGYYYIGASFTSVQQVPEPAGLVPSLLLTGTALLASRRKVRNGLPANTSETPANA
jgi:hypothetical protein